MKAINSPDQRSSSKRPRRDTSQSCQGTTIATVLAATAVSVRPTRSKRCRAPMSSARLAITATIEIQPSQKPT